MADQEPADPVQQALAAIRALSADYLARLPDKLDELEQAWRELCELGWRDDAARDLHRAVHGVTGSGRVFGLPEVSDAARLLEAELQSALDSGASPSEETTTRIASGLSRLRAVADKAIASN